MPTPPEQDAWILALGDKVFADALGGGRDWSRMTKQERRACGPPARRVPERPKLVALPQWRRWRVPHTHPLAVAARWEASALEAWALGLYSGALSDFKQAKLALDKKQSRE